jgi:hypothetical protein
MITFETFKSLREQFPSERPHQIYDRLCISVGASVRWETAGLASQIAFLDNFANADTSYTLQ